MSYEFVKEGNLRGIGNVSYVDAPIGDREQLFSARGLRNIKARELAKARMVHGSESTFMTHGSYVLEGALFIPPNLAGKSQIVLTPKALVLEEPYAAEVAHGDEKKASYHKDLAMYILEQAKKGEGGYLLLEDTYPIETMHFGLHPTTQWLFGKIAGDYGMFLASKPWHIGAMDLAFDSKFMMSKQVVPYVNQLWLSGCRELYTDLNGGSISLCHLNRARGVPDRDAKRRYLHVQSANPAAETFTAQQMKDIFRDALRSEGIAGPLEKRVLSHVRKTE